MGRVIPAAADGNPVAEPLDSLNSMEGLSDWADPTLAPDQINVDFAIDADPQATGI